MGFIANWGMLKPLVILPDGGVRKEQAMKNKWLLMGVIPAVLGCSWQKQLARHLSKVDSTAVHKELAQYNTNGQIIAQNWYLERPGDTSQIWIYPKGKFNFSPISGFTGEAWIIKSNRVESGQKAGIAVTSVGLSSKPHALKHDSTALKKQVDSSSLAKVSQPLPSGVGNLWRLAVGIAFTGLVVWYTKKRLFQK